MTGAAALLLLLLPLAPPGAPAVGPAIPGVRMETSGPPPAPLADPRGPRPVEAATWIDGNWQWTGGRYAWVQGEWTVPPGSPPYAWVPARWASDDRGFTWHEPHWSPTAAGPARVHAPPPVAHVTSPVAPPPLLVESPGTPPGRDAVWIPGFWTWTGSRWAWALGNWSAPNQGRTWLEGTWKRSGRAFSWVPGRWR